MNGCFWTPEASAFFDGKTQDSDIKTAGNGALKVSMLRGSDLARSLLGKVLDLVVDRPKDPSADASTPRKNWPFPLRQAPSPPKNSSNINLGSRIA